MTLNRRQMLQELVGSSLLFVLASACKTKAARAPSTQDTPLLPALPTGENPKKPNTTLNPFQASLPGSADCSAKAIIDASKIPAATENLTPWIKVYGDSQSGMIVIGLPKFQYDNGNLKDILILRQNGMPLCHKSVTQADVASDTTVLPLVFDNIALKGEKRLTILFNIICDSCPSGFGYTKYVLPKDLVFESRFLGKPVVSITPTQYNPLYGAGQAVLGACGDPSKFAHVDSANVIATLQTPFTITGLEPGDKFTDLLGRSIESDDPRLLGQKLAQYPEFIVYRPVNQGTSYVRTFIRVY